MVYSGSLPSKLYRYRSVSPSKLDRIINFEIEDEGVYLAGLKDLNDPDEGRFLVILEGSREEIVSYWRGALISKRPDLSSEEVGRLSCERADEIIAAGGRVPREVVEYTRSVIENIFRVACFTALPTNYSMWANYAKYFDDVGGSVDHGGICIEYTCGEEWRKINLRPIVYSDDVPQVNPISENEEELVGAIYSKSREWRCEDEWRIFMMLQSMPPFPPNLTANSRVRIEGGISGVIFGINTPNDVIAQVSDRVKQMGRSISLRRVVRDPTTYRRILTNLT